VKRILVVGTMASRPFILANVLKACEDLELDLVLVDRPEHRPHSVAAVAESNFIPGQIDDHSPENMREIVQRVAEFARGRTIDAVMTFINPYAELAGHLADRLGAAGNSAAAVRTAHVKALARERLASVPEITVPFRVVRSTEAARKAFWAMGGGSFVMKPIVGAGSTFVRTGIDSEEAAARSFEDIDQGVRGYAGRAGAGWDTLDLYPGIMMERQLHGPEIDVELVVRRGASGRTEAAFSHVVDNPPMDGPYAVEKGLTSPSRLPRGIQAAAIEGAVEAARVLGLTVGNLHVEEIITPEGPKVVEVNARMGGGRSMLVIREVTAVNLVEAGMRALLGMPVPPARERPDFILERRFINPKVSGRIEYVRGLEDAARIVGKDRVHLYKAVGDRILAAPDHFHDRIGAAEAVGSSYDAAFDRLLDAMKRVQVGIKTERGELVEHTGDDSHWKVDPLEILEEARRRS